MAVKIGFVPTFPDAQPTKEQALKIREEAAEVYSAWQVYTTWNGLGSRGVALDTLVDECADVITATCNLLAALGVDNLTDAIDRCRLRNEMRGRL